MLLCYGKLIINKIKDMKKVVILPDIHTKLAISKEYKVVKKYIAANNPDEIVILGDFMEVEAFSAWDSKKRMLMEGRRYAKEVAFANKELDFLQKHCKKITFIEGNHENRVERYIEENPELDGIINIPIVLKLKERGIEWFTEGEFYKISKMYFTHGISTTQAHAKATMMKIGANICYGHTHRYDTYMMNMELQTPHTAYGLGCLCNKKPYWARNKMMGWINQFAVMEYKGDIFNLYPITIIKGKFIINGRLWK